MKKLLSLLPVLSLFSTGLLLGDSAFGANADLRVTGFSIFEPNPILPGARLTRIGYSVVNYGPTSIGSFTTGPGRIQVSIYLSTNPVFGDGDDLDLGSLTISATLPAGSTSENTTSNPNGLPFVAPGTAGSYFAFLRVIPDPDRTIVDPDLTDNFAQYSEVVSVGIDNNPPPMITSITRLAPLESPTSDSSVVFRVAFSETVNDISASDFTLTDVDDTISGEAITSISALSGSSIDVSVHTGTGDGTLRLDVPVPGATIFDSIGQNLVSSFISGDNYIIDRSPPVFMCPEDAIFLASRIDGVKARYQITAIDNLDGGVPVVCTPPSSSHFAIGTNIVSCHAVDRAGNSETCHFNIVVLDSVDDQARATVLVSSGATWKYLHDGSDPGTNWTTLGFSDENWLSGCAPLGYGTEDECTVVSHGFDTDNKFITTYFRHFFLVNDSALLAASELRARLRRDDGAVMYLNGHELVRDNMPDGPIGFDTLALVASDDDQGFQVHQFSTEYLVLGTNVLAVEIHQGDPSSSDLIFDLELAAYRPLAPSLLQIDRSSNGIRLTWPSWAGATVEAAIDPSAENWTQVLETPVEEDGEFILELPSHAAEQYYRLH